MERAELRELLAPCGLSCEKCMAYEKGQVRANAQGLKEMLGPNFGAYAERFSAMNPIFGQYQGFKDILEFMAQGSCGGCRKQGCLFTACQVHKCVMEKGVDYCFECAEFPCAKTGMPGPLEERWRINNERMKEKGVEVFYQGTLTRPRYP